MEIAQDQGGRGGAEPLAFRSMVELAGARECAAAEAEWVMKTMTPVPWEWAGVTDRDAAGEMRKEAVEEKEVDGKCRDAGQGECFPCDSPP